MQTDAIVLHPPPPLVTPFPCGPKVLLVEDDEALAFLFGRCLAEVADAKVTWAPDGISAMQLAADGGWDAIISDVELPGSSGYDLIRTSKRACPTTATILMTGHADLEHALAAIDCDVDAFLVKPIGPLALIEKLTSLMEVRRQHVAVALPRTVLAIGAHPDDVEIGCGGALLAHRAIGERVVVATATRGACGGEASDRVSESEASCCLLGADLALGNLEDTRVSESGDTIDFLARVVADVKPDIVYSHTFHDQHQDHRAVHRASLVAARGVPSVYCYQSPSTSVDFRPTSFIDVSAHLDSKLALLAAYESQSTRAYLDDDMIRSTARYWGRFAGQRHAEPFEVIREAK